MNNLELFKEFAKLEGVNIWNSDGTLFYIKNDNVSVEIYSPLCGELNCAARDKYRAEIDYDYRHVSILHLDS